MFALNRILLFSLRDLERRQESARVTVQSGQARRIVHVEAGHLVGAESNLKSERVGDMLISEGLLDPVLLEPVAAEAARKKVRLGDQMVADGLLTAEELTRALERQVVSRMGAALSMRGLVSIEAAGTFQKTGDIPLRLALVAAFRKGVPLGAIEDQLRQPPDGPTPDAHDAEALLAALELGPAELRFARRLLAGEAAEVVVASGAPREPVLRLAGALRAIDLIR
jgi:hypothetical protein